MHEPLKAVPQLLSSWKDKPYLIGSDQTWSTHRFLCASLPLVVRLGLMGAGEFFRFFKAVPRLLSPCKDKYRSSGFHIIALSVLA